MAQTFKINVISLRSQPERRAKMQALLDGVQREWSFVDAISGKDIAPFAHLYDRQRRLNVLGYDMKPNEIACVLSHRQAWENCVRDGVPYLILEDDVQVGDGFADFNAIVPVADAICESLGDRLLARLGNTRPRGQHVPVYSGISGVEIRRYEKDPLSAFSYLISPRIAVQLLKSSEDFFVPVDDFLWRGWEHGCCIYDISPALIVTTEEGNPSSIGDRCKPKLSFKGKIKREYHRFFDNKNKIFFEKKIIKELMNIKNDK